VGNRSFWPRAVLAVILWAHRIGPADMKGPPLGVNLWGGLGIEHFGCYYRRRRVGRLGRRQHRGCRSAAKRSLSSIQEPEAFSGAGSGVLVPLAG